MKTQEEVNTEYTEYINEHIDNVQKVWKSVSDKFNSDISQRINNLIKIHDQSKYGPQEFRPYQQWFYPINSKEKNKTLFNYGWNHHQKNNPHHWEYWVMQEGIILPMIFEYAIEMLCDWSAMSLKFKDTPGEFYNQNKHKILIHDDTKQIINRYISLFDLTVTKLKE